MLFLYNPIKYVNSKSERKRNREIERNRERDSPGNAFSSRNHGFKNARHAARDASVKDCTIFHAIITREFATICNVESPTRRVLNVHG